MKEPRNPPKSIAFVLLVCCTLIVGMANTGSAQIQLDRFFPPAVQIGETSVVKAEGKFPKWPATIVCDHTDLKITMGEDSGALEITVAEDAAPGIAWIRLHDDQAATGLVPLFIERESVQAESEPNNRLSESNRAELPTLIAGRLEKSGDLDSHVVDLRAGQTLVASLHANHVLGSPMDAILQLVDPRGNVVAQSDDVRGLDPQLVYRSGSDATLNVRVFAFPETPTGTIGFAGSASYIYLLRLTSGPLLDHSLPLLVTEEFKANSRTAGWNLPAKSGPLRWTGQYPITSSLPEASGWDWHDRAPENSHSLFESETDDGVTASHLPVVFSGRLQQSGEIDRLRFSVQSGQRYQASVYARRFGFELDSVLRLIDPASGKELGRNDDSARNQYDAALVYKADADREVELQISDLVDNHGIRAVYSVLVQPVVPEVKLTVAAGRFPLTAEKPAEIAVEVKRTNGDTSNIRLVPQGLPAGVTGTEVVSKAKGDSAKSVTIKLTCDSGVSFQGPFEIVGQRLDENDQPVAQQIAATYQVAKLFDHPVFWLSVTEK